MALFDCRMEYDADAYAAIVREERLARTRTVFANVFFGAGVGDAGAHGYLCCGSSSGAISVFNLDDVLRRSRDATRGAAAVSGEIAPAVVIRAHVGAAYAVVTYGDELLCTAGEDGRTLIFKVTDVVAAADAALAAGTPAVDADVRPVTSFANPQERKSRGALGPVPETTALATDPSGGLVFAAAGDGACYGWDAREGREAPVAVLRGHADLLHCVAARPGANQVVTGSEDGTVRIFDVRSEKATSVIDPWRAEEARSRGGGAAGGGSWVGCVALDEAENWLGMGCGGGCVTMWSFAAGACVSRFTASAPLQSLRLRGDNVVAAGAEPAVYRWNLAGRLMSRQPCTPKSVFALDMRGTSLTAVGGAGGVVDLFSELGTRVGTVRCA